MITHTPWSLRDLPTMVRVARLEAGLSTSELAQRSATSRARLEAFEAGTRGLDIQQAARVARVLGLPEAAAAVLDTREPLDDAKPERVAVPPGFGAQLRARRLELGWTYEVFSQRLGISRGSLGALERLGEPRRNTIERERLVRICTVLGLDLPGVTPA